MGCLGISIQASINSSFHISIRPLISILPLHSVIHSFFNPSLNISPFYPGIGHFIVHSPIHPSILYASIHSRIHHLTYPSINKAFYPSINPLVHPPSPDFHLLCQSFPHHPLVHHPFTHSSIYLCLSYQPIILTCLALIMSFYLPGCSQKRPIRNPTLCVAAKAGVDDASGWNEANSKAWLDRIFILLLVKRHKYRGTPQQIYRESKVIPEPQVWHGSKRPCTSRAMKICCMSIIQHVKI